MKNGQTSILIVFGLLTLLSQTVPVRTEAKDIVISAGKTQVSVEIDEHINSYDFFTEGWICGRNINLDVAFRLSDIERESARLKGFKSQLADEVKVVQIAAEKFRMAREARASGKNTAIAIPVNSPDRVSTAKNLYWQEIVPQAALRGGGIDTNDPISAFQVQVSEGVLSEINETAKGDALTYYRFGKDESDGTRKVDPGIESLNTDPDGTVEAVYVLPNCYTVNDLNVLMNREKIEAEKAVALYETLSKFIEDQEQAFIKAYIELY